MTKKFEFNWQIPTPQELQDGAVFDRWTEEKDNTELELNCTFKVDEYGFFIYWKSEGKVKRVAELSSMATSAYVSYCLILLIGRWRHWAVPSIWYPRGRIAEGYEAEQSTDRSSRRTIRREIFNNLLRNRLHQHQLRACDLSISRDCQGKRSLFIYFIAFLSYPRSPAHVLVNGSVEKRFDDELTTWVKLWPTLHWRTAPHTKTSQTDPFWHIKRVVDGKGREEILI